MKVVPTLCSSESHVLIRDALTCKDSSVSHMRYGLPPPKPVSSGCIIQPTLLEFSIYEDPLMTMSDTVQSQSPGLLELNLLNLESDQGDLEESKVKTPAEDAPPSWPESLCLLENRPSMSSRMNRRRKRGQLHSASLVHGSPCWQTWSLIGTTWYLRRSSCFTVHPELERP